MTTDNVKRQARRAQRRWILTVFLPFLIGLLGLTTAALWVIDTVLLR